MKIKIDKKREKTSPLQILISLFTLPLDSQLCNQAFALEILRVGRDAAALSTELRHVAVAPLNQHLGKKASTGFYRPSINYINDWEELHDLRSFHIIEEKKKMHCDKKKIDLEL